MKNSTIHAPQGQHSVPQTIKQNGHYLDTLLSIEAGSIVVLS